MGRGRRDHLLNGVDIYELLVGDGGELKSLLLTPKQIKSFKGKSEAKIS